MAQRKNKERQEQLAEFKNKQKRKKMSDAPKIKPFRQVPVWDPNADFTIKGSEFTELQDFFNQFIPSINSMQSIFQRNMAAQVITLKYIDNDGQEVDPSDVKEYMKQMSEYYKQQAVTHGAIAQAEVPTDVQDVPEEAVEASEASEDIPKERKLKTV